MEDFIKKLLKMEQNIDMETINIRKCKICDVAMLTQPAAMTLESGKPEYYCEEHAPKLF